MCRFFFFKRQSIMCKRKKKKSPGNVPRGTDHRSSFHLLLQAISHFTSHKSFFVRNGSSSMYYEMDELTIEDTHTAKKVYDKNSSSDDQLSSYGDTIFFESSLSFSSLWGQSQIIFCKLALYNNRTPHRAF